MGLYGVAVYNAAVLGFSVFTPFVPAIVAIGGGCLFGYAVHRLFYRYIEESTRKYNGVEHRKCPYFGEYGSGWKKY